jgi:hypothetical protein
MNMALPKSLDDILLPGGHPIGTVGSNPGIREVPGGLAAAQQMFQELTRGGTDITPPTYPGKLVQLPGSEVIGLRPGSKSGPPTIDVKANAIPFKKIKFL